VADVDAALSELIASGALLVVPPTNRFWGQRTAYIRDPDGYLIELAQDLRQP
jgi:lactoylglutathione lyase